MTYSLSPWCLRYIVSNETFPAEKRATLPRGGANMDLHKMRVLSALIDSPAFCSPAYNCILVHLPELHMDLHRVQLLETLERRRGTM